MADRTQRSERPERPSIYSFFLRCSRNFEAAISALRQSPADILQQVSVKDLEDEQGRFRIWAANAGAHRKGRVSLDHKLRYSTQVHKKITELLEELGAALRDVTACTAPDDEDSDSETSDDDGSEGDDDDDDDIPDIEEDELPDTTPLQYAFKDVCHVIAMLYEFSATVLRRPAPRDRLEKSAAINVSHFEPFDIAHVREKVTASDVLIQRLGKANTRRRQLLKYHQQHHQKIARYVDIDWNSSSAEIQNRRDSAEEGSVGEMMEAMTVLMLNPTELMSQLEEFEFEKKTVNTGLLSQTTVTTFKGVPDVPDIADVESEAGASQTSFATSAGDFDARLHVPNPPNVTRAMNGEPFQCPYCFTIIKIRNLSSWKKHVFGDLKPYVCTFKDCRNPDQLFGSRSEWYDHELRFHRREWFCGSCKVSFPRREDFYLHLDSEHLDTVPRNERAGLMKTCERSITAEQECPMCPPGTTRFSPKQLCRHVGRHLQQIALFVLPREVGDEKPDDGASNANDTQGSRVSTGSGGESQDGSSNQSTLSFESNPLRPPSPTEEGLGITFPQATPDAQPLPSEPPPASATTSEQDVEAPATEDEGEESPESEPEPEASESDRTLRLPAQEFRLLRIGSQRWQNVNLDIAYRVIPNAHRTRTVRPRLYVAEHKTYDIPGIPTATVARWIRNLAELQHEVFPTDFLRCAGYIIDASNKKYYILSEFPQHISTIPKQMNPKQPDAFRPFTLGELVKRPEMDFGREIGKIKTEIAKNTATALRRIHEMGMVHKNVRSSSVLIFTDPSRSTNTSASQSTASSGDASQYLDIHHPYLTDWGYLHLDELSATTVHKMTSKKAACQHGEQPYLSIYQHPFLSTNPNTRYDARYDIYSFGLMLIEIGLWEPLHDIIGSKTLSEYAAARTPGTTGGGPSATGNSSSPSSPSRASAQIFARRLTTICQTTLRTSNPPELAQAVEIALSAVKWADKNPAAVRKGDWGAVWAKITDRLAAWERALTWQAARERDDGKKGVRINTMADGKPWSVVGAGRKKSTGGGGGGVGGGGGAPGGHRMERVASGRKKSTAGGGGGGGGASGGHRMERGGSGRAGASGKGPQRGYKGKGPLE